MIDPKEVLEECKKATPGWRRGNLASTIVTDAIDENVFGDKANRDFYGGSLVAESIHPANRDFAILARNVLPELAQRVIELEAENARLRAVAEVAKHFYGICFDMPIDFPSAGPFVWGMGDLKDALAAAGYGGEE